MDLRAGLLTDALKQTNQRVFNAELATIPAQSPKIQSGPMDPYQVSGIHQIERPCGQ